MSSIFTILMLYLLSFSVSAFLLFYLYPPNMESEFKEPTLEIIRLVNSQTPREQVAEYLVKRLNYNLYKKYIDDGILEYNKEHLNFMNTEISKKLREFQIEKELDPENEPYVFGIDKRRCEFYGKILDVENFESLSKEILKKDSSNSTQLDILMCKIRIAIILKDRASMVKNVELAKFVFENSSDWDRKNRFRVYLGLIHLIKAEFEEAAKYFKDSLASFDAAELISFDLAVFYLVFSSLIAFDRNELKKNVIDNPEVRKCREFLFFAESLFNCEYHVLFRKLLEFISYCEDDVFLNQFKEHFCKEMKIKGYNQLLSCYQSLHIVKMAECFNVEPDHIEEDLRNFVSEGRINCFIDKIDGIVRMKAEKRIHDLQLLLKTGNKVLRDIKRSVP